MNLNNFVVLPSKPKSMKLNVRNLRELRMEKVQLDKQTKEMESKLEELRERMSQEKEEREKTGRSHWRSGVLGPAFHHTKTNKENSTHGLSPGKMKIRVLKDEPLPVESKPTIAEPEVKSQDSNRKLRLKGKVCGQCEVQLAGLMCSECGEDYCVGCFVRFHQKGALQRHRTIPIQAQLQTPITTRHVLARVQEQVQHEHCQLNNVPKSDEERETPEQTKPPQVLFVNDGVDVDDEEGGEVDDSSLLRGCFDEEESARSFQAALKEWREKGRTGDGPTAALPVTAMETQTEKRHQQFLHLEFKEDTLSYMEKLLLKHSRRGQIKQFQSQSETQHRPKPTTPPPAETDELSQKLTAEQMKLRKYIASLFAIAPAEDAGKVRVPAESRLSIMDLDEMNADAATYRSSGVGEQNESKYNGGGCWKTRFHGSHHSTASNSESFPNVPRENQSVEQFSEAMPSTTLTDSPKLWTRSSSPQQKNSSNSVPPSSSPSPRTRLDCDSIVISSPASPPSASSYHSQSSAFLKSEPSPRSPDSECSRSRLASSTVKPINRNLHSTSYFDQNLTSPTRPVITSSCTSKPSSPTNDFFKFPVMEMSSHTHGNNTPPSRWLKGARSLSSAVLSLQISISDSEEDMTSEDVCLVPSEEDSSDEEQRCINDSEVKRNTGGPTVTPSSDSLLDFLCPENTQPGLLTESSQALCSIAQRRDVQPERDHGLEGFFTLGLEIRDVQLRPSPAQTPRERRSSRKCSLVQDFWRPSSSLRHNAEEELVNVLVSSQPIRSSLHTVTLHHGTSQRHQDVSSSSRIQSAGIHRPSSSVRPLSRAAQEIMEVQTVDQAEAQISDEEDEDCLALACLEEEFRNMSCTPCDQN